MRAVLDAGGWPSMVSRRTVLATRATDRRYGTSLHSRNAPAGGLGYLQATLWVPYALILNLQETLLLTFQNRFCIISKTGDDHEQRRGNRQTHCYPA